MEEVVEMMPKTSTENEVKEVRTTYLRIAACLITLLVPLSGEHPEKYVADVITRI